MDGTDEGYTREERDEFLAARDLASQRSRHRTAKRLLGEFNGTIPIRERGFAFERDIKEPVIYTPANKVEYSDVPGRRFTSLMARAERGRQRLYGEGKPTPGYYDMLREVYETGAVPEYLAKAAQ